MNWIKAKREWKYSYVSLTGLLTSAGQRWQRCCLVRKKTLKCFLIVVEHVKWFYYEPGARGSWNWWILWLVYYGINNEAVNEMHCEGGERWVGFRWSFSKLTGAEYLKRWLANHWKNGAGGVLVLSVVCPSALFVFYAALFWALWLWLWFDLFLSLFFCFGALTVHNSVIFSV